MWRRIVFTCSAMAACLLVAAQIQTEPMPGGTMEFGVQGGAGASILYNQHPLQNPRNPFKPTGNTYTVGLGYQYNFPKIVSLRAELNLEQKGDVLYLSHAYVGNDAYYQTYTNSAYDRISYATIPVMARLRFGRFVQFFTDIGLYAGFLTGSNRVTVDANTGYSENDVATENRTVTNITQSLKGVDGGLVTGLGLAVPLWRTIFFTFEARNNFGFANVNNNSDLYGGKVYNNSTNVMVGIDFKIAQAKKADQLKFSAPQ